MSDPSRRPSYEASPRRPLATLLRGAIVIALLVGAVIWLAGDSNPVELIYRFLSG